MDLNVWRKTLDERLDWTASLPNPEIPDRVSSIRPNDTVIRLVRQIRDRIELSDIPASTLTVAADGGVHIKWRLGHGRFSLFLFPDETIEYILGREGEDKFEDGEIGTYELGRINYFLRRLSEVR